MIRSSYSIRRRLAACGPAVLMGFSTAIGPAQSPVAASGVPGAESAADSESPLPPDPAPQPPAPGESEPGDGGDEGGAGDPGGDPQPEEGVGGQPGDDGQPGDGNEEPTGEEQQSAPALVLSVDSDPEAEGDQTRRGRRPGGPFYRKRRLRGEPARVGGGRRGDRFRGRPRRGRASGGGGL